MERGREMKFHAFTEKKVQKMIALLLLYYFDNSFMSNDRTKKCALLAYIKKQFKTLFYQ